MKPLRNIYHFAKTENIVIDRFPLQTRDALSVMDEEGDCFIAIDPSKIVNDADERTKLAHELGHCVTGSFYNQYSCFDRRQYHENRADKWGIRYLIALEDLDDAIASGCTTFWELAEHFGVTEQFMKKAVCYYTHGNVAAELYF